MSISSLKWFMLLCVFFALPASALNTNTDTKDCWLHIVTNIPDAPGQPPRMAAREGDQYRKRLHSNIQKKSCTGEARDKACPGVMDKCADNKQTPAGMVGVVGAYISWGTTYDDCPKTCAGFNVSPKSFKP